MKIIYRKYTVLAFAVFLPLSACASYGGYGYSYQTAQRTECASNVAGVYIANNLANEYEDASGGRIDVDAYDDRDRDTLWTSLAVAGISSLLAGQRPDGDTVCQGINTAADLTYYEY